MFSPLVILFLNSHRRCSLSKHSQMFLLFRRGRHIFFLILDLFFFVFFLYDVETLTSLDFTKTKQLELLNWIESKSKYSYFFQESMSGMFGLFSDVHAPRLQLCTGVVAGLSNVCFADRPTQLVKNPKSVFPELLIYHKLHDFCKKHLIFAGKVHFFL